MRILTAVVLWRLCSMISAVDGNDPCLRDCELRCLTKECEVECWEKGCQKDVTTTTSKPITKTTEAAVNVPVTPVIRGFNTRKADVSIAIDNIVRNVDNIADPVRILSRNQNDLRVVDDNSRAEANFKQKKSGRYTTRKPNVQTQPQRYPLMSPQQHFFQDFQRKQVRFQHVRSPCDPGGLLKC